MMTMGVSPSLLLAGVLDVLLELLLRGALLELALDLVPGLLLGLLVRLDLLLELAELLLGHVVVLLHSLRIQRRELVSNGMSLYRTSNDIRRWGSPSVLESLLGLFRDSG